jgi:hypothetical protein
MSAIASATRLLFKDRRVLALLLAAYFGLLAAVYLLVSTREATITQVILTLLLVVVTPGLFFVLQAVSVGYANGLDSRSLVTKMPKDALKLLVVSVPVIALAVLALYGVNKLDHYPTLGTTLRYLLIGVAVPLLAIQLWVATKMSGLRSLVTGLHKVIAKALAPQSVLVYACGFVVFAVVPYLLLMTPIPAERAWLEITVLIFRLAIGALLILLGWVTTVGAISILNRRHYLPVNSENPVSL